MWNGKNGRIGQSPPVHGANLSVGRLSGSRPFCPTDRPGQSSLTLTFCVHRDGHAPMSTAFIFPVIRFPVKAKVCPIG